MSKVCESETVAASALGDNELADWVERIASAPNIGLLDEYKSYLRECAARMKERGERLKKIVATIDRFEAAQKREVAAKDGERKGILKANESLAADNTRLRGEVAELTAIINAECRKCGECAKFGKDCDAGDVDGAEDRRACEKFVSKEVAELREFAEFVKELYCGCTCKTTYEEREHGCCNQCEFGEKLRKAMEGSEE